MSKTAGNICDDHEPDTVRINISGTIFQVEKSTLLRFPNSRLAKLAAGDLETANKGCTFFYDQDATLFGYILRCYRSGEVHVPPIVCPRDFLRELEFWEIPMSKIAPCCWPTFYRADDVLETLEKLSKATTEPDEIPKLADKNSWREKMWLFLDNPNSSVGAKIWFYSYLATVALSIFVYFLWMVDGLRVHPYLQNVEFDHNHSNHKISAMVETDPHVVMFLLDLFCIIVFVVEFVLRFATCPRKVKYFFKWYNTMNAILVGTSVAAFILEVRKDLIHTHGVGLLYYILKNTYVFRLLLLLRLEKCYMGLKILILSVKESAKELFLLLFSLLMAMCIFGGLMFCAEIHTTQFPDMGVSLWWALVTISTVGYGDFYPTDLPGRIIGSLCAVTGIMLLALPIAVIASKFADFYGQSSYLKRHQELCQSIKVKDELLVYANGKTQQ